MYKKIMNIKEINVKEISVNIVNNLDKCGECYICFGKNAPLSDCKCKNLFLHKKCQKRYIEKNNTIVCSICKKGYNNVDLIVNGNKEESQMNCCVFFNKNKNKNICKFDEKDILYKIIVNENIIYIK